jgi:hypothetical protein
MIRHPYFGVVHGRQEETVDVLDGLSNQAARTDFPLNGLDQNGLGDLKQLLGGGEQGIQRAGTVPLSGQFLQDMGDPRLGADQRILGNTQALD